MLYIKHVQQMFVYIKHVQQMFVYIKHVQQMFVYIKHVNAAVFNTLKVLILPGITISMSNQSSR